MSETGILERIGRLAALALLLALAVVALRILLHRQRDDPERIQSKRDYLERVAGSPSAAEPFNLVLILFDDLGYGDLGSYGSRSIHTPNLDRLAAAGASFTHAYSASPYCSGSRAGLLTGRYPVRSGLDHVVQAPWSLRDLGLRLAGMNRRLPAEEITLAEILRAAGYRTGVFGKWHLGDEAPSLPNDLGFEEYFGLLHSNDQGRPVVWRDREIVERHPIEQATLTRRYTARAVDFIARQRQAPFFLYLPHTFPHVPLHVTGERLGRSAAGLYGDVVEELDESVGAVLAALESRGLEQKTLVVVTSDNGPWFQGSPGGTRGRKMDVFEGGMRVPLIARWPGRIAAGTQIPAPVTGVDLLPTVLELAGLAAPPDRVIDGRSLLPLLAGRPGVEPEPVWFHQLGELRAVRAGRFKYHDRHRVLYGNPMNWAWGPFVDRGPWLFDLSLDPDESYDASDRHPEVARRLQSLFEQRRRELAENPRGWL